MIKQKTKWSALDTIFVLFASVTILLFLFWISAQIVGKDSFSTLPNWAIGLADKVWVFLTTGATSAVLLWLNRNKVETPNYLVGILICIILMIASTILITKFVIPKSEISHNSQFAKMRLTLNYPGAPQELTIHQRYPIIDERNIVKQTPEYFQELIRVPNVNEKYFAAVTPTVNSSIRNESVDPIEICFVRKVPNLSEDDFIALFICNGQNKKPELEKGDHGCVELCSNTVMNNFSFSLFTSAYAQEKKKFGWNVPNLNTLQNQKKFGYAVIKIKSIKLPSELSESNSYSYAIKVNDTPIFIDGLEQKYLEKKFVFLEGIDLDVGLENLGFAGINDGFEKIDVNLKFYKDSNLTKEISFSLNYAALRKNELQEIKRDDGSIFQWSSDYISSPKTMEIFYSGTTSKLEAVKLKSKLDAKSIQYNNSKIIGIIRPPYDSNQNYGLAFGLLQANKQVKFIFDKVEAEKLADFVNQRGYKTRFYQLGLK